MMQSYALLQSYAPRLIFHYCGLDCEGLVQHASNSFVAIMIAIRLFSNCVDRSGCAVYQSDVDGADKSSNNLNSDP